MPTYCSSVTNNIKSIKITRKCNSTAEEMRYFLSIINRWFYIVHFIVETYISKLKSMFTTIERIILYYDTCAQFVFKKNQNQIVSCFDSDINKVCATLFDCTKMSNEHNMQILK